MRKLLLLTSFFVTAPSLLLFSFLFFFFISYTTIHGNVFISRSHTNSAVAYAAIPTIENLFEEKIEFQDARADSIKQFLDYYNSPLEPFANDIVIAADKYSLDYRLLPAIAMQESNLCRKMIKDSYNCWGFGIYGKKVTKFDNYTQAIETVSKTLSKQYKEKGMESPDEIVKKYTPSDTGKWVKGVTHFMNEL